MKRNDKYDNYDMENIDPEELSRIKADISKKVRIIGIVIAAPFVLVILALLFLFVSEAVSKNTDKKECTEKVDAEVVRYIESERIEHYRDDHDDYRERKVTVYTAVFRFVYDGREYTVESDRTAKEKEFKVGDRILLMLDPNDPYRIYVREEDKSVSDALLVIAFIAAAVTIFVGIPIVSFKIRKKREDKYYDSLPPEERERALKYRDSGIFQ